MSDKLEECIIIALKAMKGTAAKEGSLRYLYVQNWLTNILIKNNPYADVAKFYEKLKEQ